MTELTTFLIQAIEEASAETRKPIAQYLKEGLPLSTRFHELNQATREVQKHKKYSCAYYKASITATNLTIEVLTEHWHNLPNFIKIGITEKIRSVDIDSVYELLKFTQSPRSIKPLSLIVNIIKLILSNPGGFVESICSMPGKYSMFSQDESLQKEYKLAIERTFLVIKAIKDSTDIHDIQFDKGALGIEVANTLNASAPDEILASMKHFGATTEEQIKLNQPLIAKLQEWLDEDPAEEELQRQRQEYAFLEKILAENRNIN
jgi:hypothetical protein